MEADRETNEIFIKISGRIPIPTDLEEDLDLGLATEVKVKGEVVKKEILDNQDGTIDIVYIIKPIEAEVWRWEHITSVKSVSPR